MYMQCQTCLSWVMGMNIMRRRELQLSMWSMPGPTGDAGAWISSQNEPPICRDKIRQNWILILLLPCCYWNIWYQFKCFILFPRFSRAACAVAAWACSARFKTGAVVSWSQKIWRQQKSINSQQLHGRPVVLHIGRLQVQGFQGLTRDTSDFFREICGCKSLGAQCVAGNFSAVPAFQQRVVLQEVTGFADLRIH